MDLIIIGGGINGAAIARDAALRGLKVALFEKDDFGSGASSKSSKLAHGGVRYLEHFQFGLVRESLIERALLLKNAPHLVHAMPFILPIYKGDPHPLWKVNIGLYLYDFLGGSGALPRHHKMDVNEIDNNFPGLKKDQLSGGCFYMDAQMNDSRLVIENVLSAEEAGATVYNYTPVKSLIIRDGKVKGIRYHHANSNCLVELESQIVVNATGAWSNQIIQLEDIHAKKLVEPTSGIHLVVPLISEYGALLLRAPQDGRVFFIIPWYGSSLVGTTDTLYEGNPDDVSVQENETQYLLDAVNSYFPQLKLNESSVISSFVGLRPLVAPEEEQDPDAIARTHKITISDGGMVTILGGKYTTHRKIAEEVVDKVIEKLDPSINYLSCSTKETPLPGALKYDSLNALKDSLINAGLTVKQALHLCDTYGMLATHILEIIVNDNHQMCPISRSSKYILAEITYAIRFEYAKKIEDWLFRRTPYGYLSVKFR